MNRKTDLAAFTLELGKLLGRVPNQFELDGYWETLEDLSFARVKAGMLDARRTNRDKYAPSQGRVRECALKEQEAPGYYGRWLEPPKPQPWTEEEIEEAQRLLHELRGRVRGQIALLAADLVEKAGRA